MSDQRSTDDYVLFRVRGLERLRPGRTPPQLSALAILAPAATGVPRRRPH